MSMYKNRYLFTKSFIFFLYAGALVSNTAEKIEKVKLSAAEKVALGKKIWHNESACSFQKLTWWKEGEEFASCGIGHFIWFHADYKGHFSETFPELLAFLRSKGVKLPHWLHNNFVCPWKSREAFNEAFNSPALCSLRECLAQCVPEQTEFIVQRLQKRFITLLRMLPKQQKPHIVKQFNRVMQRTGGVYALIDYVHFKGEGKIVNAQETYNNQGWGLLDVLAAMTDASDALVEFVQQAKRLLALRVQNAPAHRNEGQWLKGWHNRLDTYLG